MSKFSNTSNFSHTSITQSGSTYIEPDFYLLVRTTTNIKSFDFLVNIGAAYNQSIAKKLNKKLRNNS